MDHRFVTVQWYLRITEMPPLHQARLGKCDYFREVVLDTRTAFLDAVDVEAIFGKCSVSWITATSPSSMGIGRGDGRLQ